MGCLDSIFQVWSDKGFVHMENNTGGKGGKGSFQVKSIPRALLAALTTLSSALSLVFKTIAKSLVVETVGRVWVLGGLEDGRM